MPSAGLNLSGNVTLNATPAIREATALADRFEALAKNSRTSTKTFKDMATAANRLAGATEKERRSLSNLAIAQEKVNALQRESLAQQGLIKARAAEVKARTTDAQETAELRRLIMAEEADVKVKGAQAIAKERLNNEELRGLEIQARQVNAGAVAGGRVALTEAKAATEAVRQETILRAQQDRENTSYTRRAQMNSQARIAQSRLEMAQEKASADAAYKASALKIRADAAANAAASRAETQLRESLSVTRGALSSVGTYMTHFGALGAGIFVGFAAEAMHMDRQFANVVRTSTYLDESLSQLNAEGFKGKTVAEAQANAFASLKLQFDSLAQALPVSYKELTEIGAAANQLGIAAPNLASFTETVSKFSATTGVSVDMASTAFGRLDSLITDVVVNGQKVGGTGVDHNFMALADAINKVGVRSVATDQEIIKMSSQIAGVANAAGLGYKDIVGFSGALASVAVSPYLARGMTTRLFTNIGNAVADGGVQLQKFATVSGMSAKQFTAAWKYSPRTALTNFFDGIAASGSNAVNVLQSLGIKSVLDQPAIIRLARAADAYGKSADIASRKGGLLRQTFEDAYTAAGENARQYDKIAETMQSKLTVAFNRVQVAMRDLGEGNLGPLGALIDGLSTSVLRFTQSLGEPVKLFGQFKLPFTVGDAAGFAMALTAIVSAIALVGGVGLKAASGLIAVRQAFMGVSKFAGMASGGMVNFIRGIDAETAAAERAVAANEALAASQRAVASQRVMTIGNNTLAGKGVGAMAAASMEQDIARSMGAVTYTAKDAASAFNTAGGRMYTTWSKYTSGMMQSNNRLISGLGNLSNKGSSGMLRLSGSVTKVGSALGRAGSAVAGFFGGPLGIILLAGGAVMAMSELSKEMETIGTSAGDMSVGLSQANDALTILQGTNVSAAIDGVAATWDHSTKKFMTSTEQFHTSLKDLGQGGFFNDFAAKLRNMFDAQDPNGLNKGFNYTTMGLQKIDDGIKQLADNGDIDGATKAIQTLFAGASHEEVVNGIAHMSNAKSVLDQALNKMGKTAGTDDKNILALADGTMTLTGQQIKAIKNARDITGAFGDNAAAATEYLDAVKKAAAGAVDLNAAWDEATKKKVKDPFGAFIKEAKANYQAFVDFQKNALIISRDTGMSLAELSTLDPGILEGAVKGGKKREQELANVMQLKDAQAAFETAVAQMNNSPKLMDAFESLPAKIQEKIITAVSQGASIPDAFSAAGQKAVDAFNKSVPKSERITLEANLDDYSLAKELDKLSPQAIGIFSINILGNADPAVLNAKSAQAAINALRASIKTNAETLLAKRQGENTKDYISRLKATMTVLGDTAPAQGKSESTQHYINRLKARITVDANTQPAKDALADITSPRTIPLIIRLSGQSAVNDYVNNAPKYLRAPGSATGGPIYGPGTGTSDSIPAMLSNGEYVIRAKQTKKYRALLDQINYGANGYATGGIVTGGSARYEGTSAALASQYRNSVAAGQITELSPYDRHLLKTIAENIGVVIAPNYIAQATTGTNRGQARRGNG